MQPSQNIQAEVPTHVTRTCVTCASVCFWSISASFSGAFDACRVLVSECLSASLASPVLIMGSLHGFHIRTYVRTYVCLSAPVFCVYVCT